MKRREFITWAGLGVGITATSQMPLLFSRQHRGDLERLGEFFAKTLNQPVIGTAQAATTDEGIQNSAEQILAIASLRTITCAEGTWYPGKKPCAGGVWTRGSLCDSYRIIYTYQEFDGFKDHPRRLCCNESGRLCSDAAGSFQWLSTHYDSQVRANQERFDWDANEYFSPTNQDVATLFRIGVQGAYWILVDGASVDESTKLLKVDKNAFAKWCWAIAGTWAGMPQNWTDTRGVHNQGCKPMTWLWEVFNKQIEEMQTS